MYLYDVWNLNRGVKWKVKVSQIECSSTAKAPEGCQQYFTGRSGTMNSYNYPQVALGTQIVSYCIRREAGIVNYFKIQSNLTKNQQSPLYVVNWNFLRGSNIY